METKTFKKGEVIFRQGDFGDCLYDVYMGKVGVYAGYGTPEQKLMAEYYPDQYFGEMGLLDQAPRSLTAVAMEAETCVGVVTEEHFDEFFSENPSRVLQIMQHLSRNLRRRTNEYVDVCRRVKELSDEESAS